MGRARDIANVLSSSTNIALDSELGLSLITPTSVATTGGSATISSTGAVSFTSASAISLNGVFSSTYDNYFIIGNASAAGGDGQIRWRTPSGDDNSTTYSYGLAIKHFGSASFANDTQSTTATSYGIAITNLSNNGNSFWQNINNPFLTARTSAYGMTISGTSTGYAYYSSHQFTNTTSFTGFSIIMSSNTITGTVSVYGYRK